MTGTGAAQFPLLDWGRRRSTVKVREAQRDEAYLQYRMTVLGALRDVEDALAQLAAERQRHVALTQAVRAARRAGTVVQVGMLPDAEIGVNLAPMLAKELTLRGAFRFSTEIDDAVAMLAETDALDAVVSHVIPATDAVSAFATARDSSASAKVLLSL